MSSTEISWAGLSYGDLEALLVGLHDAPSAVIRARFRKLRLRPFPGDIQTGIGRRIKYDLSRTLAVAAVFELNRLYLPQGHAVAMVEQAWPEWSRAFTAAAVDLGIADRPGSMPKTAGSILRLVPQAFGDQDDQVVLIAHPIRSGALPHSDGDSPTISVDGRRIVSRLQILLQSLQVHPDMLRTAFEGLELKFGWTMPAISGVASLSDIQIGRGFLEDGPYLLRAQALLDAPDEAFRPTDGGGSPQHMQYLLDYLEQPAPVDVWKAQVGSDERSARLGQLLSIYGESMGLSASRKYPATMANTVVDVRDHARILISAASRLAPTIGEAAKTRTSAAGS